MLYRNPTQSRKTRGGSRWPKKLRRVVANCLTPEETNALCDGMSKGSLQRSLMSDARWRKTGVNKQCEKYLRDRVTEATKGENEIWLGLTLVPAPVVTLRGSSLPRISKLIVEYARITDQTDLLRVSSACANRRAARGTNNGLRISLMTCFALLKRLHCLMAFPLYRDSSHRLRTRQ
jgi:hypothetical protein